MDIVIVLVIVIPIIIFLAYNWKIIDISAKLASVLAIGALVLTIYYSSIKPLFSSDYSKKEIIETQKIYEDKIKKIDNISKVSEKLSQEAEEIETYLRERLLNSDLDKELQEEIEKSITQYENGNFIFSILQIGITLERSVNEYLSHLNKKHKIKLSKNKQKSMHLASKIEWMFNQHKITDIDYNKFSLIRKYRNMSAHAPTKKELIEISKNARLIIELGIEVINKLQTLSNGEKVEVKK